MSYDMKAYTSKLIYAASSQGQYFFSFDTYNNREDHYKNYMNYMFLHSYEKEAHPFLGKVKL